MVFGKHLLGFDVVQDVSDYKAQAGLALGGAQPAFIIGGFLEVVVFYNGEGDAENERVDNRKGFKADSIVVETFQLFLVYAKSAQRLETPNPDCKI
jgi:hypothetical protein